jgi:glyoxylase-like metal-dependent hydrolase (beta-lactamase superfamily II)
MDIKAFYDTRTSTLTYLVFDPDTGDAVIIDPVLDYDPVGSKIWSESADALVGFVAERTLTPHYILETHAHADHISGAQYMKERFPYAKLAIGSRITRVQETFKKFFNLPDDFPTDGRQFDVLLEEGAVTQAGSLSFQTIATPGHTPACTSFLFDDALFTGDTLFMPDQGTGRCDFPAGSAEDLYDSVQRIYAMDPSTRVFVGHDYQPGGRQLAWETTIAAQMRANVQLPAGRSREEFVAWRQKRDAGLSAPRLLFQSVQVNVDGGHLPTFFKVPVNVFRPPTDGDLELKDVSK